jgi:hypothetical protein
MEADIKYFEYSKFNNIEKIGGSSGVVNKAETNDKIKVVLKYLIGKNSSRFEEELIEDFEKVIIVFKSIIFYCRYITCNKKLIYFFFS